MGTKLITVIMCIASLHAYAQTNLHGRITDLESKGISETQVTLMDADITVTTDTDGWYHIPADPTATLRGSKGIAMNRIVVERSAIHLDLAVREHVHIALHSLNGRLMRSLLNGIAGPGVRRVPIETKDVPAGVYIIRCDVAGRSSAQRVVMDGTHGRLTSAAIEINSVVRIASLSIRENPISSGSVAYANLAKRTGLEKTAKWTDISTMILPAVDTLMVTKSGFITKKEPVYSLQDTIHMTCYGEDERIPVIYSSDLYHPPADPDDHFDLAALYGIPELDIRFIIIDKGRFKNGAASCIPVDQMNHITGRNIPHVRGLNTKLGGVDDDGLDQDAMYQAGVQGIIDTLRASPKKVTLVTVGSVRDVAAAYNREPELMREKVDRLLMFIGRTNYRPDTVQFQGMEYNVHLDPYAYACVMNSDLPIYWAPCFGSDGYKTVWGSKHEHLLAHASCPMQNYFFYMWDRNSTDDPITYLAQPCTREITGSRNMWCAGIFSWLASYQTIEIEDGHYRDPETGEYPVAEYEPIPYGGDTRGYPLITPFWFDMVDATTRITTVTDDGPIAVTSYEGQTAESRRVRIFKQTDYRVRANPMYRQIMTPLSAHLIGRADPE